MEPAVSNDKNKNLNPLQHLEAIDLMLLRGHYRDAAHAFFQMLESLAGDWSHVSFSRSDHHGDVNYTMYEVCERAARQWVLILSSGADLSKLNYARFVANIGMIHAILMGTSQGNLDDFISALHRKTGGNYQVSDFLRIVLAWCPNSRIGFDIFAYYNQAPELVMAHALGCVSGIGLISKEANHYRNKAIDFLIANRDINIDRLASVCLSTSVLDAWMRCSYADHPQKHQVKYLINRMVLRGFELVPQMQGKDFPALKGGTSGKPLLVMPLETFCENHAMYRCYANILSACREHFYMVGIAATGYYDEATRQLFDEFYDAGELSTGKAGEGVNLRVLEDVIKSWKPDLVYYPSIGMALWVIALANLRLAPVQVMTFGHPATSMSRVIDYVITEQAWYRGYDEVYSEKVVALPNGSVNFRLPPSVVRVQPLLVPPVDDVVRVAVPSVSQKLTEGFIRALRRIEEAVPKKVQFVFFIGTRSVFYAATVQSLRRQLKNIECHGYLDYGDYIIMLNRCHIHAGTFPFGGTNSLIDSLRQGLPIIAMEGREAHALVDGVFVRRAGLPDEFVCQTEDEYVDRMVALISEPQTIMKWRHHLINDVDIDRVFLQEGRLERFAEALVSLVGEKSA